MPEFGRGPRASSGEDEAMAGAGNSNGRGVRRCAEEQEGDAHHPRGVLPPSLDPRRGTVCRGTASTHDRHASIYVKRLLAWNSTN